MTRSRETGLASVEWKLDGARVQVHRSGDEVRVFTRNLNDVTARLPEVVAVVRAFPTDDFVLDGEVIGLHDDEIPQRFQDTMSRFGRDDAASHELRLRAFFFDVLHVDGRDVIDEPLDARGEQLAAIVGEWRVPALVTDSADAAEDFLADALANGHEGVMVKALDSRYEAGRRGSAWRKVKPVRTLDLVVLAAEWGHGRRRGWLSNLHLGARDPSGGEFVMVGKTFKGLTDELLAWQTERFQEIAVREDGHVVYVRARARRRDRARRRASVDALSRRRGVAVRARTRLPARQVTRRRRHHRRRCARCSSDRESYRSAATCTG